MKIEKHYTGQYLNEKEIEDYHIDITKLWRVIEISELNKWLDEFEKINSNVKKFKHWKKLRRYLK